MVQIIILQIIIQIGKIYPVTKNLCMDCMDKRVESRKSREEAHKAAYFPDPIRVSIEVDEEKGHMY